VSLVAIATTSATVDPDLEALVAAVRRLDGDAVAIPWDDPGFRWSSAELVVVRSTWDYATRVAAFLDWTRSVPNLHNPAAVVAWNVDKRYLAELASRAVPVVPTRYVTSLDEVGTLPDAPFVVKPTVGAGSRGVQRFDADQHDAARAHAGLLIDLGTAAMVQPYVAGIERGETAVVVIDGVVSHAVRKHAPMGLDPTAVPAGPVSVDPVTPTRAELDVVDAVLSAVPGPRPLCYARVDLVATDDGPVVVEVELIEPFLFLASSDGATDRLAAAIARRVHEASPASRT
jgi:glutathione synthase/RimK-type ligase-like ATP-grasp enzyme